MVAAHPRYLIDATDVPNMLEAASQLLPKLDFMDQAYAVARAFRCERLKDLSVALETPKYHAVDGAGFAEYVTGLGVDVGGVVAHEIVSYAALRSIAAKLPKLHWLGDYTPELIDWKDKVVFGDGRHAMRARFLDLRRQLLDLYSAKSFARGACFVRAQQELGIKINPKEPHQHRQRAKRTSFELEDGTRIGSHHISLGVLMAAIHDWRHESAQPG